MCYIFPNLECLDQEKSGNPDEHPIGETRPTWSLWCEFHKNLHKNAGRCCTPMFARKKIANYLPSLAHFFQKPSKSVFSCRHRKVLAVKIRGAVYTEPFCAIASSENVDLAQIL
jgi:hypothetical protein